jgi:hypothetical protein
VSAEARHDHGGESEWTARSALDAKVRKGVLAGSARTSSAQATFGGMFKRGADSPLRDHFTQSATNTLRSRGAAALRLPQKTSLLPSRENIGKEAKVSR